MGIKIRKISSEIILFGYDLITLTKKKNQKGVEKVETRYILKNPLKPLVYKAALEIEDERTQRTTIKTLEKIFGNVKEGTLAIILVFISLMNQKSDESALIGYLSDLFKKTEEDHLQGQYERHNMELPSGSGKEIKLMLEGFASQEYLTKFKSSEGVIYYEKGPRSTEIVNEKLEDLIKDEIFANEEDEN